MTGTPPTRPPLRDRIVFAVLAIFLVLVVLAGVVFNYPSGAGHPPSSYGTPVLAQLNLSSAPATVRSPGFFGINLRADVYGGSGMLAKASLPELKTVRWPGGNLAERYDPLGNGGQGIIYTSNGTTQVPAWTTAQFVSWCRSVGCQAIFTVPAEIDNASLAAAIVRYVEQTLDFSPAYWEIGNEPSLWQHFGVGWTSWTSLQQLAVSPTQYADVVHSYIAAMRAVDPTLRILGIGGVGAGGTVSQDTWIRDTVQVNGPNLSAIALHVYPAGSGVSGETAGQVYSSLQGNKSLPAVVSKAIAAIHEGCATCNISLLVDEFNAATGTNLNPFLSGPLLVPYVAGEVTQGLSLNLTTMDLWVFQSGYAGSLFTPSGNARPLYSLYSSLFNRLGPEVYRVNVSSAQTDVLAIATENTTGVPESTLLIVNLNTSVPAQVLLSSTGFPLSAVPTLTLWSLATSGPASSTYAQGSDTWTLPPESVALLSWNAPLP